ncbi:hypothetical protein ACQPZA_13575 [Pseudonocardia xinjiangensis]
MIEPSSNPPDDNFSTMRWPPHDPPIDLTYASNKFSFTTSRA